jgi:hypothetical protein
MKGADVATINKPPSHHLFDDISSNHLGQASPLLERRQRANAASTPTIPTQIQFNASPELLQLLRPAAAPIPAAALAPAAEIIAPPAQVAGLVSSDSLIPHGRDPGPQMTLENFCTAYKLTESVRVKLDENGYAGSHTFRYGEWKDLKEAGFKAGEIAQMKHAIELWTSVPGGPK